MRLVIEKKVIKGVKIVTDPTHHGHVTIIATSLKSGRHLICEFECPYSFQDGYATEDVVEIVRIEDEFIEELKNG